MNSLVTLFTTYYPIGVRYATVLSRDHSLAQDLSVDGCLRVWERISAGHPITSTEAYLNRTVYHLYLDHRRRESRLVSLDDGDARAWRGGLLTSIDPQGDWDSQCDLSRALETLPEHYRIAVMSKANGASNSEIAAALGLPSAGAAAVTLHRARRFLHDALAESSDHPHTAD